MADTDRELLEMAARAAGIVLGEHARFIGDHPQLWIYNDSRKHPMCRKPNRAGNVPWNPLADDGDALRLAVHLNLKLVFHPALNQAIVRPYYACKNEWVEDGEKHPDPYAATRRAIVRAAAEIGRAMP